ncbi:50S ribosomal protein L21 [Porphyridium purpureum]|uniref:Large ribosomal subunit protein bL21m n=1 Tax=Porphyridium purpureum TaxID=35688 RepID=A0A5J4YMK6_PORPP|nr:50S ribosomal protein L21 [Porphyridium purpureum]|eukprot:POR8122..scf295_9
MRAAALLRATRSLRHALDQGCMHIRPGPTTGGVASVAPVRPRLDLRCAGSSVSSVTPDDMKMRGGVILGSGAAHSEASSAGQSVGVVMAEPAGALSPAATTSAKPSARAAFEVRSKKRKVKIDMSRYRPLPPPPPSRIAGLRGEVCAEDWGRVLRMRTPSMLTANRDVRIGYYEILGTKTIPIPEAKPDLFMEHFGDFSWLDDRLATGQMYMTFEQPGSTHFLRTVAVDDTLYLEKMAGDVNERIELGNVVVVGHRDYSVIGRPYVSGAKVIARIEEQTKSAYQEKVVFKKRKGYTRRVGHRQYVTRIRIEGLEYSRPPPERLRPVPLIFSRGIPYKHPEPKV